MDDNQIIELYFARNEQAIKETDAKYGKLCFSVANRILEKGQLITVVYYGDYEQRYLQLTGPVIKVDPYWHSIQIENITIDFSEIYELLPC